jgi:ElaB/YqjD/DUF883 family membrane-anchored ribosome-binding protein
MSNTLENQNSSTSDQFKDSAQNIGQEVRNMSGQARGIAREYFEEGKKKLSSFESQFEKYVSEKPVQSVLIAAGVGVVLGLLWKRR